jgi:hypothetical protein
MEDAMAEHKRWVARRGSHHIRVKWTGGIVERLDLALRVLLGNHREQHVSCCTYGQKRVYAMLEQHPSIHM